MPADEVREDPAGGSRARSGPRHAAPKKPLFNRFHVPAGKAMAIAAMPTAVLMGMGLTPTLAQAKPQPKNPFQDGPCVTQPDEAGKEDEAEKQSENSGETGDAGDSGNADGKDDGDTKDGDGATEPGSGDGGDSGSDADENPVERLQKAYDKAKSEAETAAAKAKELVEKANEEAADEDGGDTAEPEPAPSPSESGDDFNPLDPLGLGKALEDLLTPDEPAEEEPAPSEPPASEEPDSGDSAAVEAAKKALADAKAKKAAAADAKKALDAAKAEAAEDAKEAADKAGDAADEAGEAADGTGGDEKPAAEDPMAPDENGKKPFPCPVEKKVAGTDEQTPTQIPNQPWFLEASSLTLKGADYKGIVNVTMPNGQTKQVMKYIINDGVDIGDLHQTIDTPEGGHVTHVEAGKGTTSTIRGGAVTMYTERLSGNLFGLIPMTFDAEHPPPLNLPFLYFTKVKVTQAGQFGGTLTVPGLHAYITK